MLHRRCKVLLREGEPMGSTENVAAFREFIDQGPNRGNLGALDALVGADCRYFMPGSNDPAEGPEGVKQVIAAFRAAFSDLHVEIDDVVAEGDVVMARVTPTGTHQGDLMGVAPTGRSVSWVVSHCARFSNGKMIEDRIVFDRADLMEQLGAT
jgi:predicted ester cyclase